MMSLTMEEPVPKVVNMTTTRGVIVDPPAGTRQHSTQDERDASGNGSLTETTFDLQPQGVLLVELKITTKAIGITDVEDFVANPPATVRIVATPTLATPMLPSLTMDLATTKLSPVNSMTANLRALWVTAGRSASVASSRAWAT